MDPILGLVGSIGGGILNNLFAGSRQKEAQEFNWASMLQQEQWSRQMRQTAYQDTMQDMNAAGLNPILAYQKGPTSSPSGAMASTTPAQVSSFGVGEGISSALALAKGKEEIENMKATNELIKSQERKTNYEGSLTRESMNKLLTEIEILKGDAAEAKNKQYYQSSWLGSLLNIAGRGGADAGGVVRPIMDVVKPWPKINLNSAPALKRDSNLTGVDKDVIPVVPSTNSAQGARGIAQRAIDLRTQNAREYWMSVRKRNQGGAFDQRFQGE